MKINIFAALLIISWYSGSAQDTSMVQVDNRPVRDPWYSSYTIDNQTPLIPMPGEFELNIIHRFSSINQGIEDLFGLYGTSNVSLSLSYGISRRFMLGFETEKDRKLQVFKAKVNLLEQTRGGTIPVSLAVYGNTAISATDQKLWGKNYGFTDRLSYFSEIIVSRKVTRYASILASVSYSHINKVPGLSMQSETDSTVITWYVPEFQNEALAFTVSGRTNIWETYCLIGGYSHSFYVEKLEAWQSTPKPSLSFGFEKNTPTHTFQLFLSSYRSIVPQYNYIMNQNDMSRKDGLMLGFNIFVRI